MKKKYFTINERDDECAHIGTLVASTSEELKNKLKEACSVHFDAEVIEISDIDINQYLYGRVFEIKVTLDCVTPDFEVKFSTIVTISESWLY